MTKHNIISDNGTVRVRRFTKNDEGTIFYHVFVGRVQYGTVARVRPASGYAYLSMYMPDGPLVSTHTDVHGGAENDRSHRLTAEGR